MAKKPTRKNKKKMSQGGKLVGPSHSQGGISGLVDGTEPIEVEGGEFIINKESAAALGDDFLHKLNATGTNMNGSGGFQPGQLGNGSSYQNGGMVRNNRQNNQNRTPVINSAYGAQIKGIVRGVTTEVDGHVHQYLILPSGKVHILPAYHPQSKQIYHTHEYLGNSFSNGIITENQSDCHPHCREKYGYNGVGPHSHQIRTVEDGAAKSLKNRRTKKNISNRFLSKTKRTRVARTRANRNNVGNRNNIGRNKNNG